MPTLSPGAFVDIVFILEVAAIEGFPLVRSAHIGDGEYVELIAYTAAIWRWTAPEPLPASAFPADLVAGKLLAAVQTKHVARLGRRVKGIFTSLFGQSPYDHDCFPAS